MIKPGMDSEAVVARFEAEQQALALMDHPGVAKIFDAGVTSPATGSRPFFVMEHVAGLPITAFCDEHRLPVRRRLELFLGVCDAVQHAHSKGIIHRDLKPSNILVTGRAEEPRAVVIDFGVAKALSMPLTERTLFTEQGQMIGTPEYMAPEQAGVSPLDIDIRADVYSLGVLLYELLTGSLPFDPMTFRRASFAEIQRIIREVEPPKPSNRHSRSGAPITKVASNRSADAPSLIRSLKGDLDWVTSKALEKVRDRRYRTVDALATDVRRHLVGEAVSAGPPSALYKMGKFVRRNRGPVSAIGLVFATLLIGFIVAAIQYRRANAARLEAEANEQNALIQGERAKAAEDAFWNLWEPMNDLYDEIMALPGAVNTRRELSAAAVSEMEVLLRLTPDPARRLVLSAALSNQARTLADPRSGNLGDVDGALRLQNRALTIRREALTAEPNSRSRRLLVADSLLRIGDLKRYAGSFSEAEAAYREAEESLVPLAEVAWSQQELARSYAAAVLAGIGECRFYLGDLDDAAIAYEKAQILRETHAERAKTPLALRNLGSGRMDLGDVYLKMGRVEDATKEYAAAVEVRRALYRAAPHEARSRRDLALALSGLSQAQMHGQSIDEARRNAEDAAVIMDELVAEEGDASDIRHRQTWIQANLRVAQAISRLESPNVEDGAEIDRRLELAWSATQRLLHEQPDVSEHRRLVVQVAITRARWALARSMLDDAQQYLLRAEDAWSGAASPSPWDDLERARVWVLLGEVESARATEPQRPEEERQAVRRQAREWFERALAACKQLPGATEVSALLDEARAGAERVSEH